MGRRPGAPRAGDHGRLRPSARAFVLFAARRRACRSRSSPSSPRPTGSQPWRSPTPTTVRRARILRKDGGPASSRSSAARWPSIAATRTNQMRPAAAGLARRRCRGWCCSPPAEAGYRNLMHARLARLSRPSRQRAAARQARRWLDGHADGLIALTGGPDGPIDRIVARASRSRRRALDALLGCFGDRLYVELQRHGLAEERAVEPALIDLAYDQGHSAGRRPTSPSSPPPTTTRPMTRCCASPRGGCVGEGDRRRLTPEHRFKTRAEMSALFADLPEALGLHRRDRAALLVPPARRASRSCRAFRSAGPGERLDEARRIARSRPKQASRRRLAAHGVRAGHRPRRTTASGSTSSSASSSA